MTLIHGSKGGGGGSSPVEADDTLSSTAYAQILDLLGEGPIAGFPDNLTPAQCVYFNDTPLQNADGSYNFNVKQLDYRLGYVDQTHIAGFESSVAETQVGVALTTQQPWSHTFTNVDLSAARITLSVSGLSKTDTNTGNIYGYRVAYQIQVSKDGGSFSTVIDTAFDGKASSTYTRSHRIELSGAKSQYTVRVVRLTPDGTTQYIQDKTSVVSYAEVIDAKLSYPYSALVALQIDAEQFSSMPTRAYDVLGLLVKYPSNYNPKTRAYTGTWDGTFSFGWTDNPAWIFYDLVLNKRYGLGRYVDATMLDRYALYQIGRYCDVLVSDGKGGQEPRFTCNCYIASRADAIKVIQDLASVFRGIAYWSAGSVIASADMPSDPVYVYTAANVVKGEFKYVGSSLRTRYTTALVTYNDPGNAYKQTVEYVEDADGINRYGINKAEITAFGCTSRSQAQRVGQWSLLTSRYETNAVTFSVGMDGTLAQPGQVIAVADPARARRRIGGRLLSVQDASHVTLDQAPPNIAAGDSLTVIMPTGIAQKRAITSVSNGLVQTADPFSTMPLAGAVWMVESSKVQAQLFRVTSVSEKEGITFEISATQHEPGKYAAVDSGAAIDPAPIIGLPLNTQQAPGNVRVSQFVVVDQGITRTNMTIAWDSAPNAIAYIAEFRKDNGDWITAGRTGGLSIDVSNIYTGRYAARVRAVNALDIVSPYAFSKETVLQGKTGAPPLVASLTASTNQVFAVSLDWAFPPGASDTAYTEVYFSHTPDFFKAVQQGRYSYPTNTTKLLGLAAGYEMYFWVRLVDTTGNIGAWFPATNQAGIRGMSSSDATDILSYLTGKIGETQLGKEILDPIKEIPGIKQGVSDNAGAISKETADRIAAINAEADARSKALADEAAVRGAAITSEQKARQDADSSLGSRIDTVTAANGANAAAIQSETTARTNADSALSSRIDTVTSKADSNSAAITSEAKTRADADSAMSGRIDALKADVGSNAAAITSEATARTNADSALSGRIDTVSAATATNAANISSETKARADADAALSTRVDKVSAQLNVPMAGDTGGMAGATSVYAGVWSEQSARAEADLALSQRVDTVTAQFNNANNELRAAVRTESEARATADSAQAQQITTIQAQANDNSAAVQTVAKSYADLNGQLSASYTVKTQITKDGRTYMAGISLGVNGSGGDVESQILMSASRFAIIDPNGSAVSSPFIVQGGQVFLNDVFIGNGRITNAMIGSYLQSDNYVAGRQGWRLDKSGWFEINNTDGQGNRLNIDSNGVRGYDANGTLRYRLGFY
ncbi:host specificity protein [Burkholderia diffusa]|uniref:phage tail protein n=1 Tax=Burkholderia diffusa TaxID=488732 RepID=UPI00075BA094|nr:phage tail protein [Burkholderia diffusa]KUZ11522.1 host specificity protein [Burkholderia diffusa]